MPKWISLYLSQFLTVFDEPKIKLKVINVVTRLCNTHNRLTGCNWFQPVFEWFWMIFEMRQPATRITPNLGNHNQKIDRTMVWFSSILWIFSVHRTEPANTIHHKKQFTEHIPSMDAGLLPVRPRKLLTDFCDPLPLVLMTSPSSDNVPPPNTANPASEQITPLLIPYPHMLHLAPPPEVLATPLPDPQSISATPAWNPSLRTPLPGDNGEDIHTIK